MRWWLSWRADPVAAAIADRHYSRQTPGARQFVPAGRDLVLRTACSTRERGVLWVTSWPFPEYVAHEWAGAWTCSVFRNERPDLYLSSELIREAIAATRSKFGDPPPLGMVTFVDVEKVRTKRDPGRCFRRAGFEPVGYTKERGYLALLLDPSRVPDAIAPNGSQETIAC